MKKNNSTRQFLFTSINLKIFFSASVLLLLAVSAQARIIRVNNSGIACTTPTDCYTTLSGAYASANPGDTIHIEPSGVSYGNLTIAKRVIILGNGYFLGTAEANGNPNLQANTAPSLVDAITINNGADGTIIKGLTFNGNLNIVGTSAASRVSNLIIARNRLTFYFQFQNSNNVQFIQNYSLTGSGNISAGNNSNVYISNNVLSSYGFIATDDGVFENNIIISSAGSSIHNFTVQNNITVTGTTQPFTNCTVRNNIGNSTQYGNLNGNQQNIVMTTVFEDLANASLQWSEDSRYTLKAGSPAIGTGFGGVDCGIFGGPANPYRLSGIPDIPSIYKLTAPATVTSNTLNVTISTKVNQ